EAGEDKAFQGVAMMLQGQAVELDTEYSLESAAVGLAGGLAVADSIIYATTLKCDGVLWTQDARFAGKANVKYTPKLTGA
ncbi:MAG: VapC toxin family PIN domain ribonuclease, partial [Verrucomicrobiota bacterium]